MSVEAVARLERICSELDIHGRVRVTDLATALDVSEMTIRRDLDTLADQGQVRRVRGGALALGPQRFTERYRRQARAKQQIALKLTKLLGESGAIGMDASSTIQRLATSIGGARELTVLTNGLECFMALRETPGITALLTGGRHDARTDSLVGPLATRAAKDLVLDRFFTSAAGLTPEGTTEASLEEAEAKLALAAASGEVVLAVDRTKLGRAGPAKCLPLDRIAYLVTDLDPKDSRLAAYRRRVKVL